MPHCIIEYSKPVEQQLSPEQLMTGVFHSVVDSGLFEADNIKTRSQAFAHYQRGGTVADFIHVTLYILDGRSEQQKQKLAQAVLQQLKSLSLQSISLTVDVREMERAIYAKYVN